MRDLLNLLDKVQLPLIEGVGLTNRKPGEKFKNSVGDIVTFQGVEFYPESGAVETPSDLVGLKVDAVDKTGRNVHWVNQPTGSTRAFMISTFTGEDNKPYYLGKWVKEINPNKALNNFAHSDIPGEFKFQSKAGQKENSGLKPSEWLTQFQDNTPQTILDQCIAKFGEGSDEANALSTFISGNIPVEVAKGNMNATAFRDYFAEVLQPIALVMGKKVSGNAAEASNIFFGPGDGYSDCTISFNNNTIGGLYDSLLVNPEGKQIKLSSKGKDGANASVVNLIKSVRELEQAPAGTKLKQTYAEEIELLETILKRGHFGAPLDIAEKYKLINSTEAEQVMNLKNLGPNDDIIGTGTLSKRLEGMYQARKARDMSRIIPIEHMIAAIAYKVADYVNKHTRFGEAASTILNNSALVQMYTDTSDSKDSITITKLNAVYPSQTVTGVLLDASKAYMSTQGKGNFTFEILKNGAKPSDVNPMDGVDSLEEPAATSADELDTELEKPRLTGPGARASRAMADPKMTKDVLGREKRKR
jgi:hypothetical protein